jgi:hypothetical protein
VIDAASISRWLLGALAAVLLLGWAAENVRAGEAARLTATFVPYRLGGRATIVLDFEIRASEGRTPSALTEVEVRYPQNLGFALSGLGIAVCSASKLEAAGTSGCPANSIMGRGRAVAELRLGPQLITESASISIARAPDQEGHIALLLYAVGPTPVNTQILSPAQLLPTAPPFGGRLNMQLPVVSSVPGAPAVAIASMHVTLGPQGLTYYEHVDGSTLAYTPRGILMPTTCPRGGFHFAATFSFLDGSSAQATDVVACRKAHHHMTGGTS